jgi:hypothetical protein
MEKSVSLHLKRSTIAQLQPLAISWVERHDVLLFCRTTGHEARIGSLQRRADRLCVVGVVLSAKPEGLRVLRANDSNGMPEPFKPRN